MYSISINGEIYDRTNLHTLPMEEEWQQDIVFFLGQWFDPEIDCFSFQTSGTTGPPKEIHFTRGQLAESAWITIHYFDLNVQHTGLLCLPCKYVAGRMMLVRASISGMDLRVVPPSLHPLRGLKKMPIHFAAMTPAQVYHSLEEGDAFAQIEQVIVGGGTIPPALEQQLATLPNRVYATYGMTETLTHVAVRRVGQSVFEAAAPSIGFFSNGQGELEVSVPHLYPHRLTTHDVVELTDQRHFRWLGRTDHIINSGGVKLYPEQMEARIAACIQGKFYITSQADAVLGEVPVLVCEEGNASAAEVLEKINGLLGKYEQIRQIIRLPQLEETETGKLRRRRF